MKNSTKPVRKSVRKSDQKADPRSSLRADIIPDTQPEIKEITFHQNQDEISFHQADLIRLFAFGLSVSQDGGRPFLLLKDEKGIHTLPVAVNPLEAGVALSHANHTLPPSTPHKFSSLMLKSLNIELLQCVFVQIKGAHQYVRVYFNGHKSLNSLKVRADEAMSFCLHQAIPIYATLDFINKSKVMSAEIQGMNQAFAKHKHLVIKNHSYLN